MNEQMKTRLVKKHLKKRVLSILLSIAMVINVAPLNVFATTGGSNAIVNYNQAVDVIINADKSYTGSLSDFTNNLNNQLTASGVSARTITVNNNISFDNFDDWYVYDNYFSLSYPTDGSTPSDWNSYSGRHPYYYYNEEEPDTDNLTTDQIKAVEPVFHDTLYPECQLLIYACQDDFDDLSEYYGTQHPYSALTSTEKAILEPGILKKLNEDNNTNATSLDAAITLAKDLFAKWDYYKPDYASLTSTEQADVDSSLASDIDGYSAEVGFSLLNDSDKRALADAFLGSKITGYSSMTVADQATALANFKNTYYDRDFGSYLQAGESFATLSDSQKTTIFDKYYYDDYIRNNDELVNYAEASYYYYTDLTGTDMIHYRDKHIYTTSVSGGSINMTFLGYSTPEYKDFKLYPSSLEIQKTVDFDIDASVVDTHTLQGAGFLFNSGIDTLGYIHGYILFYGFVSNNSGEVLLLKINDNVTADSLHKGALGEEIENYCTTVGSPIPFAFDSTSMKKHVSLSITPTTVTCTNTDYTDAAGTILSSTVNTLLNGETLTSTGLNGFGPIASYTNHGCSAISKFTFSNLKMQFMSMPVDTLRNATYRSNSNVPKIFINLTDETEKAITALSSDEKAAYNEMQTRLAQDHIFYISTGGHTIIDSINGNGLDLSSSTDAVTDASDYITNIAKGVTNWVDVNLSSLDATTLTSDELLPTAIFDVQNNNTGNTVLEINRAAVGSGITLSYGNLDKSISRASDTSGGALTFTYKAFDPYGNELTLSDNHELTINQSSPLGDYTFALTVTDSQSRVSKTATRTLKVTLTAITPEAPAVTADDTNNILLGADATMEYSTDGGTTWNSYSSASAPTFPGKVTVKIRVQAMGINYAGEITTVDFTENPVAGTPSSNVEKITVDVKKGESTTTAVQISIDRTTNADGTKSDYVTYDTDKATETLKQLQAAGENVARIEIPDIKSQVEKTTVTIPTVSLDTLAKGNVGVEIDTEEAKIQIPVNSVQTANSGVKTDLYFNIVPVKQVDEKNNLSNRAILEATVLSGDANQTAQIIGNPVIIDTNIPSTAVDIVLPLTGITFPVDPSERKAFIDQLAVYIEHSDGTKEIVQGEIVDYSTGVVGIKFHINKFSTFTVINTNLFVKSAEKDVLKVIVPTNTTITGTLITAKVDNAISTITADLQVSEKAIWKLYQDSKCTTEIKNNLITLVVGKNLVYVKVTAEDGSYKIYKMTIIRANATPIKVEYGFNPLRLIAVGGVETQKLSFTHVSGADGYVIYGAPCGLNYQLVKIATLTADEKGYKVTGLDNNTYYKYQVKAYKIVNGKKVVIAVSKIVHSTTTSKKYADPTKVASNTSTVSLKVGKSKTVTCKIILPKGKTNDIHIDEIRYDSTNKVIATVDSNGKITAKAKGTCYIYAYAQNGVHTKIKVTVK